MDALRDYLPSDTACRLLESTPLALLVGPSGSGRNSLIQRLLATGRYEFVISDTTRQPRTNDGVKEQNGREYWFASESRFLRGLRAGRYLAAELIHGQQVSGISMDELRRVQATGRTGITDADIGGAARLKKLKTDLPIIMVLPPDFNEWRRRLLGRGTMPADEYKRRLKTALTIYDLAAQPPPGYAALINDNLEEAALRLDRLIKDGGDSADSRKLAASLAAAARQHLSTLDY